MRAFLLVAVFVLASFRAAGQVDAPPEVTASAVAAVKAMGEQVCLLYTSDAGDDPQRV
jgi:hypothetical protein